MRVCGGAIQPAPGGIWCPPPPLPTALLTAEWAPLMMGGRDRTTRLASYRTGYTTLSLMMGTNFFSFWSLSR